MSPPKFAEWWVERRAAVAVRWLRCYRLLPRAETRESGRTRAAYWLLPGGLGPSWPRWSAALAALGFESRLLADSRGRVGLLVGSAQLRQVEASGDRLVQSLSRPGDYFRGEGWLAAQVSARAPDWRLWVIGLVAAAAVIAAVLYSTPPPEGGAPAGPEALTEALVPELPDVGQETYAACTERDRIDLGGIIQVRLDCSGEVRLQRLIDAATSKPSALPQLP